MTTNNDFNLRDYPVLLLITITTVLSLIWGIGSGIYCIVKPECEFCQEMEQSPEEQEMSEQERLEQERIEQEQIEQERAKRHETINGIQFSIVSTKLTNEGYLMSMGIPSYGNSPVLAVIVNVKNNGQKPYKPNVRAQLIDENGAIYAGNAYVNVYSILNSAQNILNPGMEKEELLFFKIPENKQFTIELQDGSLFGESVFIQL